MSGDGQFSPLPLSPPLSPGANTGRRGHHSNVSSTSTPFRTSSSSSHQRAGSPHLVPLDRGSSSSGSSTESNNNLNSGYNGASGTAANGTRRSFLRNSTTSHHARSASPHQLDPTTMGKLRQSALYIPLSFVLWIMI